MQAEYLVPVKSIIYPRFPREARSYYRFTFHKQFDPLVPDIPGIHVTIGILVPVLRRQLEKLVPGVRPVASEIQMQAIIKEFPFRTEFKRAVYFRLHLLERSRIRSLYSSPRPTREPPGS